MRALDRSTYVYGMCMIVYRGVFSRHIRGTCYMHVYIASYI